MRIVIVDYGSGNLRSAAKAFERAEAEAGLRGQVVVSADPKDVADATHLVLPGVGAFGDCKSGLDALSGMTDALEKAVQDDGKPFLGICVGMQLLATVGREHGDHQGLNWIGGEVVPLTPSDKDLKIPHMGWNQLAFERGSHPLFDGLAPGAHAYFVHSFGFKAGDPASVLATVDYGGPVSAVIGRDNMVGTQFHPEKSQATGLALITNFLKWKP
ncbi:imidazole glycerol phosphate synthase subunit HisH [Magnetospira sp. QH-2]|uniref:imidazole glycerol phosphate synthase subunit HisH n=1 Tax=Magnetospira sp. (strain QH-2) TaxID=1288970 RepID=UPI0003E81631|nr:imidazole glycerol phosphate synthase subunit HisH [Magnetospira sp. QH-2]CCQ75641.1 imidazole glycerol phosphate synthase subunit hisH [Magnetospira sp. QH-2]